MVENSKIHYIPAKPPKRDKPVGIYCCVSTNSVDQLKNLTAQVSVLTRLVAATPQWLLVDIYMDIASSKTSLDCQHFSIQFLFGHTMDSILYWSHIIILKFILSVCVKYFNVLFVVH